MFVAWSLWGPHIRSSALRNVSVEVPICCAKGIGAAFVGHRTAAEAQMRLCGDRDLRHRLALANERKRQDCGGGARTLCV